MRIGYPCVNRTLGCQGAGTFRLASYTEERQVETVSSNLACLETMLRYNVSQGILFFRLSSNLVPFASHPVCRCDWQGHFADELAAAGAFVREHHVRISMHPDQFTLLNSPKVGVLENSLAELRYHAQVLDLMGLDVSAKIQLHVGGVYGDRVGSMARFLARYDALDEFVRRRLVIENDDVSYPLADVLRLSEACGVPALLDTFHHSILNEGEPLDDALGAAGATWGEGDGLPMVDYATQEPGARAGRHAETLVDEDWRAFLAESVGHDMDVMLEIRDKEHSALRAVAIAADDQRLFRPLSSRDAQEEGR